MLGDVVGVVSSNPMVIKYFLAFTGIVDLLYLSIYIYREREKKIKSENYLLNTSFFSTDFTIT